MAGTSVVGQTKIVPGALVTDKLIAAQPSGSPQRVLLQYWSDLQYQAWTDAASSYDPGLVDFVGLGKLIGALEHDAVYYRATRPRELSAAVTGSGQRTIRFKVKDLSGADVGRSMTFHLIGGAWRIFFDPFLGDALQSSVQTATQLDLDPGATKASAKAIQAGVQAGRLPLQWLDQIRRRGTRRGRS